MKALVKFKKGVGNMEIQDVPEPKAGAEDVKIKVKACGICGTDIHILRGEFEYATPVILGHEFTGVIVEKGTRVKAWEPGERVVAETTVTSCGRCRYCRTGSENICIDRLGLGRTGNGAFAEYLVLHQRLIHTLPPEVDFLAGALSEPLACCVHGVLETTRIEPGDWVIVMGPGPIGLLALQLAKVSGGRVVVCGISSDGERLALARDLGADLAINVEKEDVSATIRDLTEGYGADVVLECSGAPKAADLGLEVVRKHGTYTQIGLFGQRIQLDFQKIAVKELKVYGSVNQQWTSWNTALKLLEKGKVQTRPLISNVLPLAKWKVAFQKYERHQGMKIVLLPPGEEGKQVPQGFSKKTS